MFYESVVATSIFYVVVCWGRSLRLAVTHRLNKLIQNASSVLGVELDSVHVVAERRMLQELLSIMDNVSHPRHGVLVSHVEGVS